MNIAIMKHPDNIFTILLSTIPRLYYYFNRYSKCRKSNISVEKRKQKKQASVKTIVDEVNIPKTKTERIIGT